MKRAWPPSPTCCKWKRRNTSAQTNYLNAVSDYRLSYAALELATGELAADSPAVTGIVNE